MTKSIFIFLGASLLGLAACQRGDNPEPASEQVTISVAQPLAGSVYHTGETVPINATVQANGPLHGYTLQVFNKDNGEELMAAEFHVHESQYPIQSDWVDTMSTAAALELKITVIKDHDGNKTEKSVFFQTQP